MIFKIKRIVNAFRNKVRRFKKRSKRHKACAKTDSVLYNYGALPHLTKTEKAEYKSAWPSIDLKEKDMTWARVYKREHGFSPYIVGLYQSCVLREILNPKIQLHAFDNKALCDIYFPEIHFAQPFVRRIAGSYFDSDMNHISIQQAIDILKNKEKFFIKPALDTMQGTGVRKVVLDGKDNEEVIHRSFAEQKKDFIAQEVLKQHPDIEKLNPSSINCCRVTTIFINGKFDYSTCLKIGKEGGFRDNWNSSYFFGVSKDGITYDVGYDVTINKVQYTDNGIKVGGIRLPKFPEMISTVSEWHRKYFPNCGMIGWDVFIDDKNEIRIMEMNITIPGFVAEQLCCGPFFEPFADDINKMLRKKV